MAVAKKIKTMFTPVYVDVKTEMGQLPNHIAQAARKGTGGYPYVVLTDAAMNKVYGSYGNSQMKSLKFSRIFKEAKKKAKADIENNTFATYTETRKSASDETEDTASALDPEIVTIENPSVETWTSSKGSEIKAKLTSVEDEATFVFVTEKGKTLRVTADKLSSGSVKKARLIAGLD